MACSILFIFTGGTVGSTAVNGFISADPDKPFALLDMYRSRYGIDFDYRTLQPYTELSENNNGAVINSLLNAVIPQARSGGYDGIIVTHGTDTIQYSAAALAYTIAPDIPIMLLSADRPLEDKLSNGLDNMRAAVEFIKNVKTRGVWVPYRNTVGGDVYVHFAARLLGTAAFSDMLFSADNSYYGRFDADGNFYRNEKAVMLPDEIEPLNCGDLEAAARKLLFIEPYPGMSYPDIEGIECIIHKCYHSGTINTKNFYPKDFFQKAAERGTLIFAAGIDGGRSYESVKAFSGLSVIPIKRIAPIAAYVKAWISLSAGADPRDTLPKALGFDMF